MDAQETTHAFAVDTVEALDDATRAIAEVLDLEQVLQLIADRVADLVDARYAALGMVDERGRIERFVTTGLTAAEREAIGLFARQEGVLLDPVYTGRAAAGLIDLVRKGFFAPSARVLFWHTGGQAALFASDYQTLMG